MDDEMNCWCASATPLALERKAIADRAKRSRDLERSLALLVDHPDREHQLRHCSTCGAFWQRANAWNWGAKDYFFVVPRIGSPEWIQRRFVDPDELLLWSATIERYLQNADLSETDLACRESGCPHKAIRHSTLCLRHHIESLQSVRILPSTPEGQFFGPYEQLAPEKLNEYVARLSSSN